jgi:branched-subunit amino acid transport protein AzlD
MSEAAVMIPFIAAMAAATALTRFLPFWLPRRWLDGPLLRKMREGLPASILLILLVFSLKDVGIDPRPGA